MAYLDYPIISGNPVISTATYTASTATIAVTLTDNGTSYAYYGYSTSNSTPSSWTANTSTSFSFKYYEKATLYIFVKDELGNISSSKSVSVTRTYLYSQNVGSSGYTGLIDASTWTYSISSSGSYTGWGNTTGTQYKSEVGKEKAQPIFYAEGNGSTNVVTFKSTKSFSLSNASKFYISVSHKCASALKVELNVIKSSTETTIKSFTTAHSSYTNVSATTSISLSGTYYLNFKVNAGNYVPNYVKLLECYFE